MLEHWFLYCMLGSWIRGCVGVENCLVRNELMTLGIQSHRAKVVDGEFCGSRFRIATGFYFNAVEDEGTRGLLN